MTNEPHTHNWRDWPMICRPRYGAANTKAYRRVQVYVAPIGHWMRHGAIAYKGPLRSLNLGLEDPVAWVGDQLVWSQAFSGGY